MERLEPSRTKDRKDNAEPIDAKSNTDKQEARRAVPKTLAVLPNRAKLLKDSMDPRVIKSNTDSAEPSRANP
jgi:hypothetical protein